MFKFFKFHRSREKMARKNQEQVPSEEDSTDSTSNK